MAVMTVMQKLYVAYIIIIVVVWLLEINYG